MRSLNAYSQYTRLTAKENILTARLTAFCDQVLRWRERTMRVQRGPPTIHQKA
ncbi:hypothetical protein C2E23DRAFT_840627 [Lenzites betulinus]|nr:hypothetical protein C2E23DRAFT_840627 [Lenzites betulinus]